MEYNKIDQFIGDKIKDARLLKRMSQKDLADYTSMRLKKDFGYKKGISYQAVSLYEKGERSMPEHVYSLFCQALGIDADSLFNEGLDYVKRKANK